MAHVLTVACPVPKVLQERLANGEYAMGAEGLEKRCNKCGDYWPADSEFFAVIHSMADGLRSTCKACCKETRPPCGPTKTKERNIDMNQNKQTTQPHGTASISGWKVRVLAALESGQKPTYDDLEEGVAELLAQAATARRAAGLGAPPAPKPLIVGDKNFAWAKNIDAALAADRKPDYADLDAGLHHLLEENAILQQCMKDTQSLIARMVVARHAGNTAQVLADLDDFVTKFVTITTKASAKKPH